MFLNVYGTLENIVIEGNIHIFSTVTVGIGRIVETNYGQISNLTNNAPIRGHIVNENHGTIINSLNNATMGYLTTIVTAPFARRNYGEIINCINTAIM